MRAMPWILWGAVALAAGDGALKMRDIEGRTLAPFAPTGPANVLLLVSSDCPVSNGYAPEIQRICAEYAARGVSCTLAYEDPGIDVAAVRRHMAEYRYRGMAAVIDGERGIATRAKAAVTPEAVVVDRSGVIRYRGRIDNRYAAIGKQRPQATVHDLDDALSAVLAGKPVSHPETESVGCFIVSPDVVRK